MKTSLLSLLFAFCLQCSYAQFEFLDPTFGTNGIVRTDAGTPFNYNNTGKQVLITNTGSIYFVNEVAGYTIITKKNADGSTDAAYGTNGNSASVTVHEGRAVLQADGKIIIAGYTENSDGYNNATDIAVARFNTDGSLDESFSGDGVATADFSYNESSFSVALQPDGMIVVAGYTFGDGQSSVTLVRFTVDGQQDSNFSSSFGGNNTANGLAIQADGKIVVVGSVLFRLNADLSIDASFNGGNAQPLTGQSNYVALQNDGKIVVAGFSEEDFVVARYNTDGTPDNSFNGTGSQTTDFGGIDKVNDLVLQPDGKILLVGYSSVGGNNDFAIARYNTNGSLDNSFSGDGKQITAVGTGDDAINTIAVQADGHLVALGSTVTGLVRSIGAARYDASGNLDNTFDGDGILVNRINQGATTYTASAVQSDGKLVTAGYTWNGAYYDFLVTRYNVNGTADNSFSSDGLAITNFGSVNAFARAIVIQADGKIVVSGAAGNDVAVARYNTNGTPDNTFDLDGGLTTDLGGNDLSTAVAIQADGKIVVAGSGLIRYNTDGSLDVSFDGDGKLPTTLSNSLAIQPDGKILTSGPSTDIYFMVARYNTDGSPDETFDGDGVLYFFDFAISISYNMIGTSVNVLNNGNIVIGGYVESTYRGTRAYTFLTQLTEDGSFDFAFNGGQPIYRSVNENYYSTTVAIQSDGKIIQGGYSYTGHGNIFTIARYNPNGTPDVTFSGDGVITTRAATAASQVAAVTIYQDRLYAVGYSQNPGRVGTVARYFLPEAGPLPVTLFDFKANLKGKTVLLQWETVSEQNLAGFEIQRSIDGSRFTAIDYVTAKGNSSVNANYSTVDNNPFSGRNYYRLRMVDQNGKFSYSKIAMVEIKDLFTWSVFPNPAANTLFITTKAPVEKGTLRIVDLAGKILQETAIMINGNNAVPIDIAKLPKGVYTLQLHTSTLTEIKRFIKQ